MSKQCYFQKFSPGQRVVEDTDYKLSNSMDAYYNFCSVILSIKSYDFLVLDSSGHQRSIISFSNNEKPKIDYIYP